MTTSEDHSFVHALSKETIGGLRKIWNKIGLHESDQEKELSILADKVKQVYETTLERAIKRKDTCEIDLTNRETEVNMISLHLGEPKPEYTFSSETTLLEKLAILNQHVQDLRKRKEERVSHLSRLKSKLYGCYDQLDLPVEKEYMDILSDITPARVVAFEDKLKILSLELENRKTAVAKVVMECETLLKEIGLGDSSSRSNPLDLAILNKGEGLKYSLQVIEELSKRAVELHAIKDERIARVEEVGKEIESLWDKLKISTNMRTEFLEGVAGITPEAIRSLEDELARLRQVRKDRLVDLVLEARESIRSLWEDMDYPADRREYFAELMTLPKEALTEEILRQHEEQVAKLEHQHEAIQPFLKYIQKREEIIADRAEYEEGLKDPDRLLKVGRDTGRLLREEKLQTRIKKDLPKVTDWLQKKIPLWEADHQMDFFYKGERYLDRIEAVDRAYREEKEAHKAAKEKKKRMERERDINWGSTPRRIGSKEMKTIRGTASAAKRPSKADPNNVCALSRQAPADVLTDERNDDLNLQHRLSLGSTLKSPRTEQ